MAKVFLAVATDLQKLNLVVAHVDRFHHIAMYTCMPVVRLLRY